jgi:hypothetical protein
VKCCKTEHEMFLDEEMIPKISDFGLAKIFAGE